MVIIDACSGGLTTISNTQGVTTMTYSTPELLLVGAAQNLVLGPSPDDSVTPGCLFIPDEPASGYQDDGSW